MLSLFFTLLQEGIHGKQGVVKLPLPFLCQRKQLAGCVKPAVYNWESRKQGNGERQDGTVVGERRLCDTRIVTMQNSRMGWTYQLLAILRTQIPIASASVPLRNRFQGWTGKLTLNCVLP